MNSKNKEKMSKMLIKKNKKIMKIKKMIKKKI